MTVEKWKYRDKNGGESFLVRRVNPKKLGRRVYQDYENSLWSFDGGESWFVWSVPEAHGCKKLGVFQDTLGYDGLGRAIRRMINIMPL